MGDILVAVCPCLYESEMLLVGCGFSARPALVPAHCRTCHKFISVDPTRARVRCSTCRRKPEVLEAFLTDEDPDLSEAFECPMCGMVTAVFHTSGVWD